MASKFSIEKRKKYKLSREAAMEIILNFCEHFDVDVDSNEDRKSQKQMDSLLNSLLDFVRRGFIEIKEDFTIVQHLQKPPGEKVFVDYKRITGKQKMAMDGLDETDRYGQIYACLGAASGLGDQFIQSLEGIDLKVAEALSIAFL